MPSASDPTINLNDSLETDLAFDHLVKVYELIQDAMDQGINLANRANKGATEQDLEDDYNATVRAVCKEIAVMMFTVAYMPQLPEQHKTQETLQKLRSAVHEKIEQQFLEHLLQTDEI